MLASFQRCVFDATNTTVYGDDYYFGFPYAYEYPAQAPGPAAVYLLPYYDSYGAPGPAAFYPFEYPGAPAPAPSYYGFDYAPSAAPFPAVYTPYEYYYDDGYDYVAPDVALGAVNVLADSQLQFDLCVFTGTINGSDIVVRERSRSRVFLDPAQTSATVTPGDRVLALAEANATFLTGQDPPFLALQQVCARACAAVPFLSSCVAVIALALARVPSLHSPPVGYGVSQGAHKREGATWSCHDCTHCAYRKQRYATQSPALA